MAITDIRSSSSIPPSDRASVSRTRGTASVANSPSLSAAIAPASTSRAMYGGRTSLTRQTIGGQRAPRLEVALVRHPAHPCLSAPGGAELQSWHRSKRVCRVRSTRHHAQTEYQPSGARVQLTYTVRMSDLFWMWLTSWFTPATVAFGLFFISALVAPGDHPRALDLAAGIGLIVAAFTVAPAVIDGASRGWRVWSECRSTSECIRTGSGVGRSRSGAGGLGRGCMGPASRTASSSFHSGCQRPRLAGS